MKKSILAIAVIILAISCTKEQPGTGKQDQSIPESEFQALKKEVEELKATISSLTPGSQDAVSKDEFEALKQENEALKAQVASLTSTFFEVDGLRFDKNGSLISVPRLESEIVEEVPTAIGTALLTTTRSYDAEGRVIQINRNYNTNSEWAMLPFYWQKVFYEYNGKTCRVTTQTNQRNMGAGVPYLEEITETTYW